MRLGETGLFSASEPATSNLLAVNPSALFFNALAAQRQIVNQSRGLGLNGETNVTGGAVGLQVPAGQTLALVGGNVLLNDGNLTAKGGRIEIGSVGDVGEVKLNQVERGLILDYNSINSFGEVRLENTAVVDVTAGGGGSIAVNAADIFLDNSFLNAGILSNFGSEGAQAGDINLNATSLFINNGGVIRNTTFGLGNAGTINIFARDTVSIDNGNSDSFIFNNVGEGAAGGTGGININTGSLFVKNGAQIQALTRGKGSAGNITITARDTVSFDGRGLDDSGPSAAATLVIEGAEGDAGDINITTRILSLSNRAQLLSNTESRGNAGNINIEAREQVSLLNSIILSEVSEEGGVGNGGDINIKTGTLSLKNGSALLADLENQGERAGNIKIEARDAVILQGRGPSAGSLTNIVPNQITSTVDPRAVEIDTGGKGGDISISTNSLNVTDEGFISTGSFGVGDAGNVTIAAGDRISFDGNSGIFSFAQGGGRGGDINIETRSLALSNGSQLDTSIFDLSDPNNRSINVRNVDSLPELTIGNAGNILIFTDSLALINNAQIGSVTNGFGDAGVVGIAADTVTIAGNSGISSAAAFNSVGDGAAINISTESLFLSDGGQLFTSTYGLGNAGDIRVYASNGITVSGGSLFEASSFGSGDAGNVDVVTDFLRLNNAEITAEATSGNGGNIELQVSRNLGLRNTSRISTSAGTAQQPGNGGNIRINTPFIIAAPDENSDITANAFSGSGGSINISSERVFGLIPRSRQELQTLLETNDPTQLDPIRLQSNDITAISQANPSLSGTVSFNAADIDPSRDIVELPTTPVDASTLVASGCPSGAENRFVVAGRGGLPPAPGDKLSADALLTHWATLTTPETSNRPTAEKSIPEAANTTTTPLVEATTWQFGSKGEIILTNADSTTTNQFNATPSNCPSS